MYVVAPIPGTTLPALKSSRCLRSKHTECPGYSATTSAPAYFVCACACHVVLSPPIVSTTGGDACTTDTATRKGPA